MKAYKPLLLQEEMSSSEAMKVFGIDIVPDKNSLNNLYKTLSKKHHPDLGGDVETMKQVNQAYDVLKKIPSGAKSSSHSAKDWEDQRKKEKEESEKHYKNSQKLFNTEFDKEGILKYLQQFTTDELFIDINERPYSYSSNTYSVHVKVHNKENTTVFYVNYMIWPGKIVSGGLSYADVDEKDILYDVAIDVDIYYNNRKWKLSRSTYQWRMGYKIIKDYEKIFPKVKLKKIFGGSATKQFKKADFYTGLKRELTVSFDNEKIFIYPFGQGTKSHIYMYRSTLGIKRAGEKPLPYYSFGNFNLIDASTQKYYNSSPRIPKNHFVSFVENEENMRKLIDSIKELKRKAGNLDEWQDSKKIYDIANDIIEREFPKNY
jgi:hypothetical protein